VITGVCGEQKSGPMRRRSGKRELGKWETLRPYAGAGARPLEYVVIC